MFEERKKILRIIDANFNRTKEALRVCEDVTRFILDDKKNTFKFKNIRHKLEQAIILLNLKKADLLKYRDIAKDVARASIPLELKRKDISDIFFANIQRLKESIRVLEELSKLFKKDSSEIFKRIRYHIYSLEKEIFKKFKTLSHS